MNLLNRKSPVDLDQLRAAIEGHVEADITPEGEPVVNYGKRPLERPPLQIIAQAITRLTWADAEAMGAGIEKAMKDGGGDTRALAAAIQAWAKEPSA